MKWDGNDERFLRRLRLKAVKDTDERLIITRNLKFPAQSRHTHFLHSLVRHQVTMQTFFAGHSSTINSVPSSSYTCPTSHAIDYTSLSASLIPLYSYSRLICRPQISSHELVLVWNLCGRKRFMCIVNTNT